MAARLNAMRSVHFGGCKITWERFVKKKERWAPNDNMCDLVIFKDYKFLGHQKSAVSK